MLNGTMLIEYWGARTSAELFAIIAVIASALGCTVASENTDSLPGGDESSFTLTMSATPEQFRHLCDGIRARKIRVKSAQLGEPEFEDNNDLY